MIFVNRFSTGSTLEIYFIRKMAAYILYQQVLSQYMVKTQWIVIKLELLVLEFRRVLMMQNSLR